jgi:hypothetical protein
MTNWAERVCLLGPPASGKSQLLAAMVKAAEEGAYGYPSTFNLSIMPMDEKLREARDTGRMGREILNRRDKQTVYARGVADAEAGRLPGTVSTKVPSYDFDISFWAQPEGRKESEKVELSLTVCDAAGIHIFPRQRIEAAEAGDQEAARDELISYIFESIGLVIVLPFHDLSKRYVADGMKRLIAAVTHDDSPNRKLMHIALALHQYERLFMNFGCEAATLAFDTEIVLQVVERAVGGQTWFEDLVKLDHKFGGPFKICILPTSAYGFLPDSGNPNVDPRADGNEPFVLADEDGAGEIEYEFYPFLAADPFVFAATGIPNEYMVCMSELAEAPAPEPAPKVDLTGDDADLDHVTGPFERAAETFRHEVAMPSVVSMLSRRLMRLLETVARLVGGLKQE